MSSLLLLAMALSRVTGSECDDGDCGAALASSMLQVGQDRNVLHVPQRVSELGPGEVRVTLDQKGKDRSGQRLFRPEWQQTLRCADSTEESCQACSGKQNCFFSTSKGRYLKLKDVVEDGTRYQNKVSVYCEAAEEIKIKFTVSALSGGTLHLFWDGDEIVHSGRGGEKSATFPIGSKAVPGTFYTNVRTQGHAGGHRFTLEFRPKGVKGRVKIELLRFMMKDEFQQCQDNKVCLHTLGSVKGGLELRSNNTMQMQCLTHPESGNNACSAWYTCLNKTGNEHKENLLALMKAAGVTNDASLVQKSAKGQQGMGATIDECVYPPNEDPESWDCNCYENMMSKCAEIADDDGYDESLCLKAQMCSKTGLCQQWFRDNCDNDDIWDMRGKLDLTSETALLARRQATLEEDESSLDSDLDSSIWYSKQCI